MLTVACVWVQGNVPYTIDYVWRLKNMVARHLDEQHEFVCVTDSRKTIPGLKTVHVAPPGRLAGWWSKLHLFNREAGLAGRVLYLDLDTLVVNSLEPIARFPAPFALVPHSGTFNGKDGKAVVKRFNSSVMVWDSGEDTYRLWDEWSPTVADLLHGDQDWIGMKSPDAAMMPLEWFPRMSELYGEPPPPTAKVVLVKKPKNEEAAKRWPWFKELWR